MFGLIKNVIFDSEHDELQQVSRHSMTRTLCVWFGVLLMAQAFDTHDLLI